MALKGKKQFLVGGRSRPRVFLNGRAPLHRGYIAQRRRPPPAAPGLFKRTIRSGPANDLPTPGPSVRPGPLAEFCREVIGPPHNIRAEEILSRHRGNVPCCWERENGGKLHPPPDVQRRGDFVRGAEGVNRYTTRRNVSTAPRQ